MRLTGTDACPRFRQHEENTFASAPFSPPFCEASPPGSIAGATPSNPGETLSFFVRRVRLMPQPSRQMRTFVVVRAKESHKHNIVKEEREVFRRGE